MIVTAHQPNYLPGVSVIDKIRAADAVIWLDAVQFTKGGYTNRQQMPDGSWLTVPLDRGTLHEDIKNVRISYERDWPLKHTRTLQQHYGAIGVRLSPLLACKQTSLAILNLALLYATLGPRGLKIGNLGEWYTQSELAPDRHISISEQLAIMTQQLGGSTYLSGPSGHQYLQRWPFRERGIEVIFHSHDGPNPCHLSLLA